MRLRGVRSSRNIEDRRRHGGGGKAGLGGVGLLVVLAIGYFAGFDVTSLLQQTTQASEAPRSLSAEEERAAEFTSHVLATTEHGLGRECFSAQVGRPCEPHRILAIFSGQTASPCGNASGATGPFYCPADEKAYLDTEFFATLSRQLGAGRFRGRPM